MKRIDVVDSQWNSVTVSRCLGVSSHQIYHLSCIFSQNYIGEKDREAPPLWFGLSAGLYVCFHRCVEVSADIYGEEERDSRVKRS